MTTVASEFQNNYMNGSFRTTNLTSENILSERIFKNQVLDWLTNG
jgi:hypothetical protein